MTGNSPVANAEDASRGLHHCAPSHGQGLSAVLSAELHRMSVSFGRTTQNSFPSGSARTVQDSAPVCPMSTRRVPVALDPAERHIQRRRIVHEIEQVIEPAARIGRRPTVKLGLHPRYPRPRPLRGRILGAAIRRRILRHCSLLPSSKPLPPFPMRAGFPRLGVLRRLRPARPFSGRRAYPGQRAGCPPPGTAARRFPCSLSFARRRRSPAVSQRPRHEYAAVFPRGLPARGDHRPPVVPAAS